MTNGIFLIFSNNFLRYFLLIIILSNCDNYSQELIDDIKKLNQELENQNYYYVDSLAKEIIVTEKFLSASNFEKLIIFNLSSVASLKLGNLDFALFILTEANNILEKDNKITNDYKIEIYNNLLNLYSQLNNIEMIDHVIKKILSINNKNSQLLLSLATSYIYINKIQQAENIIKNIEPNNLSNVNLYNYYNLLAIINFKKNEISEAEKYFLMLLNDNRFSEIEIQDKLKIINNLSVIYDSKSEYKKASELIENQIIVNDKIEKLNLIDRINILSNLAKIKVKLDDLKIAETYYLKSIHYLEKLLVTVSRKLDTEEKINLLEKYDEIINLYVNINLKLYIKTDAFNLFKILYNYKKVLNNEYSTKIFNHDIQNEIKKNKIIINKKLFNEKVLSNNLEVDEEIFKLFQEEKYLRRRLIKNQEFANIDSNYDNLQTKLNSLTEKQSIIYIKRIILSENDILYLYFIFEGQDTSNIKLLINKNGYDLENKYYNNYKVCILNKLYDQISYEKYWKFVDEKLLNKNEIYLITDGIYDFINIESFCTEKGKYIFDKYKIININDFQSLGNLHDTIIKNKDNTLLLGNNSKYNFNIYNKNNFKLFKPLVYANIELDSIFAILKLNNYGVIKNINNNIDSLLKLIDSYQIIHFATHGYVMENIFNEYNISFYDKLLLRSGLIFSNYNIQSKSIALVFLTSYLINAYNFSNTKLVVLSACNSGIGNFVQNFGTIGLRSVFVNNGTKNLIFSLWPIDDKVTFTFMKEFYNNLAKGQSIKDSFFISKNLIKEKYNHPYYWASFIHLINY